MTVEEVRQMPNSEWLEWSVWHARRAQEIELQQKMASSRGKGGASG